MGRGIVALQVSEATVSTVTVTIKALKINNRQLTQAVFRQLPERSLIDAENVELLGLPWGWDALMDQLESVEQLFLAT